MYAIYVALICVGGALLCSVIKQTRPELATGVAIALGVIAIGLCVPSVASVIEYIRDLSGVSGIKTEYVETMLRACGIAIVSEFGSQICLDAGEKALSGRILLGARLTLLGMSIPIIADILSLVRSLLLI